jgi:hypothetical protein
MSTPADEANGISCSECLHGRLASKHPPLYYVCLNPTVLATTGGPRSCRDMVRSTFGLCRPEGHLFAPRVVKEVEKEKV